jgi:outer membrane lipoprotein SlyB
VAVGSVAGAIFGALIGAATGGVAGAKLGEVIDQRVLDNYVCQDCGLTFSHHDRRDQPI